MNIKNIIISFENDYSNIFRNEYISIQEVKKNMDYIISNKHIENPVVIQTFDDSFKYYTNLAECVENITERIILNQGKDKSILLIGRYNFDLSNLERTGKFEESQKFAIL